MFLAFSVFCSREVAGAGGLSPYEMHMGELPGDLVAPDYQSGTLANIPATLAALLGAPFEGLPPLREELWRPFAGRTERVILLLIDSFGHHLYWQQRENLAWFFDKAHIAGTITSVFPSTTVAALSSLWTGYAPAQHGLIGLRLFFPDLGVIGEMLRFSPVFGSYPGALLEAGLEPKSFLAVPGFAQQLAGAGIPTHAFKNYNIIHSALSQMHGRGVAANYPIFTAADLLVQLCRLLEDTAGQPLYASAYWPDIDTLMHVNGPDHASVVAELQALLSLLKRDLLDRLSPKARRDTVLFVTGDHGQVLAPPDKGIDIAKDPTLQSLLLMRAAGEPRTAYLYARQGKKKDLIAHLTQAYSEQLVALDAEEALESGLFGPQPFARVTRSRIGDVVATMRDGHLLLNSDEAGKAAKMIGRHGGLSAAEMEVPWLGFHLDS